MDINDRILFFIFLLVVIKLGELFFDAVRLHNKKEKVSITNSNTEKIKILLEDGSIDKVDNFINKLISNAIDQYMIMRANTKEHYINEKESEAIIRYTYATIKSNMTQNTKDVIGLLYDISTEQKLEDLLMLKIKINVLALLVDNNKVIE